MENSKNEMVLRNYQAELLEKVKEQNAILFLPTGSGKTCIALWLIKCLAKDLKKSISHGGKRTYFLVNTVELVRQQTKYIRTFSNLEVVPLSGDVGIDFWKKEQWDQIQMEYEVLVMTSQIYLDAIIHGYLLLKNANLLIFDECHHGVSNHPMREIMKRFEENRNDNPRVLGLSATLLNANSTDKDMRQKLFELEMTFKAKILTSKNYNEIEKFSTKPKEIIEHVNKFQLSDDVTSYLETLNYDTKIIDYVKLKDNEIADFVEASKNATEIIPNRNDILLNAPGLNRHKLLKNVMKDIDVHIKEFGLYFGYECCQCYIIQLYRFFYVSTDPPYLMLISYVINLVQQLRKFLYSQISKCSSNENFESAQTIRETSTPKLEYLINALKEMKADDKCILFVERKMTAKTLFHIIKAYTKSEAETSHIKVDFIVGSDTNPLRNTREGMYDKSCRKRLLKNFKNGSLNVLIATNILEEGIDLQNCNFVIMFDELKTYRSYVQSKGRARMINSKYIILNDVAAGKFERRINEYRKIEKQLELVIDEKDIMKEFFEENSIEDNEFYSTATGASIKPENSVSLIYRYCNTLPHDVFTELVPYWWISNSKEKKICKLRLPVNSAIRSIIEGPERSNAKSAQRAVAFEAVKMLHMIGALNDHLLPLQTLSMEEIKNHWLPNWEVGTGNNASNTNKELYSSIIKIPKFLQNCRPLPNTKAYIHIIRIKPEYEIPEIHRRLYCHGLLTADYELGLITRCTIPEICEFPIYTDLGKIKIKIQCNAKVIVFNEQEIEDIEKFHKFLFFNVLKVVKKYLMYKSNDDNYFIVPLKLEKTGRISLVWKVIRKKLETRISRPSNLERLNEEYDEENYLGKVITPWYTEKQLFYIVTKVKTGLNLQSEMNEKKMTYADYFHEKYGLTALRPAQPMMEVRVITNLLESIVPRPVAASQKQRKRLKKDFQTYLAPEFCLKQNFPSVFWYKSIVLPSVLHRFYYLLLAEDLRQKIVNEASLGSLETDNNDDESFFEIEEKPVPQITNIQPPKLVCKTRKIGKNEKILDCTIPKDIYHGTDVTKKDIEEFVNFVEKSLFDNDKISKKSFLPSERPKFRIDFTESPNLLPLKSYSFIKGPNQYQILQALTLKGSNDSINLERLETLGDSFLKYAVSFVIFIREQKMNEGFLTSLKSKLIGNEYLFYCGRKLGIPSYMKKLKFVVGNSWCPPGFFVPQFLKNNLSNIAPVSSLLCVKIPYHEQFSGEISCDTIENIQGDLKEFIKNLEKVDKSDETVSLFYLDKHQLTYKSISDVMEALIGVYLQTSGIEGAFGLLKYFGILAHENFHDVMSYQLPSPTSTTLVDRVEFLIPDYASIEELLNYHFNDKAYILQALTHPSCMTNTLTDCYQKLEFLGDAVLDFLITSYIYEYCGNLSPGQVTDLRSALVNNNTFGAFAVKLGLHKFLLSHSKPLQDAVEAFLLYQQEKNYEIHGNELMILINDEDCQIAEEIDVPKALGDIFESIAGAIFLDSKYNLKTVWHIYYNIMKEEIAKFSERIPVNPVRALYEQNLKIKFSSIMENENSEAGCTKARIRLCVLLKNEIKTFVGQGTNLAAAKRAAAKLALKKMGYSDFVI